MKDLEKLIVKKNKDQIQLEKEIEKKRKIIDEAYNTMKAYYKEVSRDDVTMKRIEDKLKHAQQLEENNNSQLGNLLRELL